VGRPPAVPWPTALWITDLDPIKYDLLFERFLNPSRISMPDIDMDFDSRYRDEMIRYAAERYGRDHVAQIVTFSTIKARAAVRDAARVLGYPYAVGDKVAKAMPPLVMGRDTPLYACLEQHPKFEDGYKMAADLRQMYARGSRRPEGDRRGQGLGGPAPPGRHPRRRGGDHQGPAHRLPADPAQARRGPAIEDAPVVTQYEMGGVEELGLLKMDFLGLRNLDVISDTLELIQRFRGVELDIDRVPSTTPTRWRCCAAVSRSACSSWRAAPCARSCARSRPSSFEDVAALMALYRPGPMSVNMHNDYADRKNGRKPVTTSTPTPRSSSPTPTA
jgi:DNA polymerase-3 subunit alpha